MAGQNLLQAQGIELDHLKSFWEFDVSPEINSYFPYALS